MTIGRYQNQDIGIAVVRMCSSVSFYPLGTSVLCSIYRHNFPALVMESAISSRSPDAFWWRVVFQNRSLGAGWVHCCWSAFAL